MRLLSFFVIALSFPMVLHLENKQPVMEIAEFCIPALGYCMDYNNQIFLEPERDVNDYGGSLRSDTYPLEGKFTAKVDALQLRLEQHYMQRMKALETEDPNLTELNSMIGNGFYYLSVRANGKLHYFQAWSKDDRLVQLELTAPTDLATEVWEKAVRSFRVSFR